MVTKEKTGNCSHQSKIKAFLLNWAELSLWAYPKSCVCALMLVILLPFERGFTGPYFTRGAHDGNMVIGGRVPSPV